MEKQKKARRRKLARVRAVRETTFGAVPTLSMELLKKPVDIGYVGEIPGATPVKKLVVQFEFPCPCCGKGVAGEIVGRV